MADISTWLKDLLPRTPGASRAVVTREFFNTCREFYEQSLAWQQALAAVNLVNGTSAYTPTDPDANSEVLKVLGVVVDNIPIGAAAHRPVLSDGGSNRPRCWYITGYKTANLFPTPNEDLAGGLVFYVALKPTVVATVVPDIALVRHYDALLDGCLGRLYAHPAKPYSNIAGAEYHLKRFRNAIALYKGEARQGYAQAQNWRFPSFAM